MRTLYSVFFFAAVATGCGTTVGAYSGADRPDDAGVLGPSPPVDYHCEQGERRVFDTDHDGRADTVAHVGRNGEPLCLGTDRDADGRIDTWEAMRGGRVVQRARDTDRNGTLDERARDTNNDGTLDAVERAR